MIDLGAYLLDPRDPALIPEPILESLRRYRDTGGAVGGFLTSVLAGDLLRAIANADRQSLLAIGAIVAWVINEVPGDAVGSYENVERRIARGGGR